MPVIAMLNVGDWIRANDRQVLKFCCAKDLVPFLIVDDPGFWTHPPRRVCFSESCFLVSVTGRTNHELQKARSSNHMVPYITQHHKSALS